MRYKDSPVPPPEEMSPPGWSAKVMRMAPKIGDSIVFGSGGGQPQMRLTKTFFSPGFGTLIDRFGVRWMVVVPQ